eukprot:6297904-Amphidinium_carterae.1
MRMGSSLQLIRQMENHQITSREGHKAEKGNASCRRALVANLCPSGSVLWMHSTKAPSVMHDCKGSPPKQGMLQHAFPLQATQHISIKLTKMIWFPLFPTSQHEVFHTNFKTNSAAI